MQIFFSLFASLSATFFRGRCIKKSKKKLTSVSFAFTHMYIHPRKTNTFTFFPQAYMENFSWFLTRKLVSFYVRQQHYSIAGREVKKLGAALARHTGQEEGEAVSHIWSRMGILLQRGNAAILGNRIPALPGALIDGII